MQWEMIGLLMAAVLTAGMAIVLLTGIAERVSRVSFVVWGTICGCILVPAAVLFMRYGKALWSAREGVFLLWACVLACFGFVVVRYAEKYEKKIAGIYALVTGLVLCLVLLGSPSLLMEQEADGRTEVIRMLHLLCLCIGNTAVTILFSLCFVAERRPVKVKRWMRVSYLFCGLGIMSGCILSYGFLPGGSLWSWSTKETIQLALWLLLAAYLHEKGPYEKRVCMFPFAVMAAGMLFLESGSLGKEVVSADSQNSSAVYLLLVAILLLAGAFGVWLVKRDRLELPDIAEMDHKELIRYITTGYAVLLFFMAVIQSMVQMEPWREFYILLSACYVVVMTAMALLQQERMPQINYIAVLVWNTLITMGMIWLFPKLNTMVLVLFWICLFPVTFFLIQCKTACKELGRIRQLMFSLLLLGIVASSGFSLEYAGIAEEEKGTLQIADHSVTLEEEEKQKVIIIHRPSGDYVVDGISKEAGINEGVVVSYHSRPLIGLFWIGGFGLLLCTIWTLVKRS